MRVTRVAASSWRGLRAAGAWLVEAIDAGTVFLFVGLALLAAGCAQVWLPAAYLVPGGVLVFCGVWPPVIASLTALIEACSVPPERKARR